MKKLTLSIVLLIIASFLFGCGASKQKTEEQNNTATFQATIVEINNETILVKPLEGFPEAQYSDVVNVFIQNMPSSPEPNKGDVVEITYSGIMNEEYPPSPAGVVSVEILEHNG